MLPHERSTCSKMTKNSGSLHPTLAQVVITDNAHISPIISFDSKEKMTRPIRRSRVMLFINMNLNPAHRAVLAVQC
jgi:hypothetical protein